MPESVQSCFELSVHLPVWQTSRELLPKIVGGKKNTGKCMETSSLAFLETNCALLSMC